MSRFTVNSPRYQTQTYRLWTYDVWGNARDGFDVNDRYSHGAVEIRVRRTDYNVGLDKLGRPFPPDCQFSDYTPTDRQLSRAVGVRGADWDGESDFTLYATSKRNGRPLCELERVHRDSE
jgi:hypothetical protein